MNMTPAYYFNQQGNNQVQGMQQRVPMNIPPTQPHYLQQQQQQQQYKNQPMMNDLHRKRVHSKSTRPNLPVSDEVDEPSGDELDDISARDIAMARYKRNHDYLSEIFTPYNASSILPPPLDISQSKEELKKQIDQYKERTQSDNVRCKERIASLEKEYSLFWQKMNDLNEANSLESIEDATRSLSKDMNSVVEHNPHNVKILSIPDVNDDELMDMSIHDKDNENGNHGQMEIDGKENEDQKDEYIQYSDKDGVDSMDMYFDQIEDTNDDSANDFFNDMVNTEDDPLIFKLLIGSNNNKNREFN